MFFRYSWGFWLLIQLLYKLINVITVYCAYLDQWRKFLHSHFMVLRKTIQWLVEYPRRKQKSCLLLQSFHTLTRRHRISFVMKFFRRTPLIKSLATSFGRLSIGVGGAFVGSYIGWLGLLKSQESSEYERLVSRNDCGSTPLWRKE